MGSHNGRTYVVTGSDSGIGAETARRLEDDGGRVIRCGLNDDCDVRADLATVRGRAALVRDVYSRAPGGVDGLALVAALDEPTPMTVRVNYFGTLAVLQGLNPLLQVSGAPRAVIVSSAASLSSADRRIVRACLCCDEVAAIRAAERAVTWKLGRRIYRSTKVALNRWVRRHAGGPDWAGCGIPLNVIAPGIVDTELVQTTLLADPAMGRVLREALPQPLAFPGSIGDVAQTIAWTLGPGNSFMTGQILFVDGGADAALRGEAPYAHAVRYPPSSMARMVWWSLVAAARRRFQ